MKAQAFNPFLPSYEYIPDAEPYVFGDRVYIYGSHDRFDGSGFCLNDYVCWSAPVDDLGNWRYEGVIYRKTQDPQNPEGVHCLYAPDLQKGPDGRYYLYYSLDTLGYTSVAVCDTPAGDYAYYGAVHYPDGRQVGEGAGEVWQFDPGVLLDDGRVFLYTGFAPEADKKAAHAMFGGRLYDGCYCYELEPDMLTVRKGPERVLPGPALARRTDFAGHPFFEASSPRKIGGQYYLVYSSLHGHELCYATAKHPEGPFAFGGTIISNGDVNLDGRAYADALNYMGNNHGGLVQIGGQWFIFYHRQTNRHSYSRQACAEPISLTPAGVIPQVEMTSCGLNGGPLKGIGRYEAYIACNLKSKDGSGFYTSTAETRAQFAAHPYFSQSGEDRENDGDQYIANIRDGAQAGFKHFAPGNASTLSVEIRGSGTGSLAVVDGQGRRLSAIPIVPSTAFQTFTAPFSEPSALYQLTFRFEGNGSLDFRAFTLA